jgi:hypothetical protein
VGELFASCLWGAAVRVPGSGVWYSEAKKELESAKKKGYEEKRAQRKKGTKKKGHKEKRAQRKKGAKKTGYKEKRDEEKST